MELKWPRMVTVRPGSASHAAGRRLHWPEYHVSLVVPPACSAETNEISASITSDPPGLTANLLHHDTGDWLASGWMDESFRQMNEDLEPTEPAETVLSVVSRRFGSRSLAGYKVQSDDVFRNGTSAMLFGPADRAADLARFKIQLFDSVRFVHTGALTEDQVKQAVLQYLNVGAQTGGDLFLYLDRHFYVMRNDVMEIVRILAGQAEKEGHPSAPRSTSRWKVLQEARKLADEGDWDRTLADLRASGS
jgi:hypothetical protein